MDGRPGSYCSIRVNKIQFKDDEISKFVYEEIRGNSGFWVIFISYLLLKYTLHIIHFFTVIV